MLNVLVVDDSKVVRRVLSGMLGDMGHTIVAEAASGKEAIDAYVRYSPNLIMMDITMPDMDGITAVMEIRKISMTPKIIMATSHGQEDIVHRAIRAGACGYILKPTTFEKLEKAIHKVFPHIGAKGEGKNDENVQDITNL